MQTGNIYQKAVLGDLSGIVERYEQFEPASVKTQNNPRQEIIEIEGKHPICVINYTDAEIDFSGDRFNRLLETNQRPRAVVITDYRDSGLNTQTGKIHQITTLFIRWKKEVSILKMSVEKNESGKTVSTLLTMVERFPPSYQPLNRISIPADKVESLQVFSYQGYNDQEEYYCTYKDENFIYYSFYRTDYMPFGWKTWMAVERKLAEGDQGDGSSVPHTPLYLIKGLYSANRLNSELRSAVRFTYEPHSWSLLKKWSKTAVEITGNRSHYLMSSIGIDIVPPPSRSISLKLKPKQTIEVYKSSDRVARDVGHNYLILRRSQEKEKIHPQVYLHTQQEGWRKMRILERINHATIGEYVLDDGSPLHLTRGMLFRWMKIEKIPQEEWASLGISLKS